VKKIRDTSDSLGAEGDDLVQEIAILARIKTHFNVVSFLGFCESPLAVCTEFVEGGSLMDYSERHGALTNELAQRVLHDVASGMMHLAAEKIVHKGMRGSLLSVDASNLGEIADSKKKLPTTDLAGRNILLTSRAPPFSAKVCDFGLAREFEESDHKSNAEIGPLKITAPESLSDRIYSEASDAWSFGILGIECLTGRPPFPDKKGFVVAAGVMQGQIDPAEELPSGISLTLRDILTQCFARDRASRPVFKELEKELRG
jgi:serine/threonine protein kinase